MTAKGNALRTKATNESGTLCLCMMVTATSVEADPIGVRLPPRFAPKITAHQSGSPGGCTPPPGMGRPATILASIAASGMLSVTELNTAEDRRTADVSGTWTEGDQTLDATTDERQNLGVLHHGDDHEEGGEERQEIPVDGAVELVGPRAYTEST